MVHFFFDPSSLNPELSAEWQGLQTRIDEATANAIEDWESGKDIEFDNKIWGDIKYWLLRNIFHNKCAYCETRAARDPGDADHFRPKGQVTVPGKERVKGSNKITVKLPGGNMHEISHPGYFWLAYSVWNLLPSCKGCNSRGKGSLFPVRLQHLFLLPENSGRGIPSKKYPGYVYPDCDTLNRLEDPLLLHPLIEPDPSAHLRFGFAGIEAAVDGSQKGLASIEVYKLDEDLLRQQRQLFQDAAFNSFLMAMGSTKGTSTQKFEAGCKAIQDWIDGREAYSAAACDWIQECYPGRDIRHAGK